VPETLEGDDYVGVGVFERVVDFLDEAAIDDFQGEEVRVERIEFFGPFIDTSIWPFVPMEWDFVVMLGEAEGPGACAVEIGRLKVAERTDFITTPTGHQPTPPQSSLGVIDGPPVSGVELPFALDEPIGICLVSRWRRAVPTPGFTFSALAQVTGAGHPCVLDCP